MDGSFERHAKRWWLLLPLALTGTVATAFSLIKRRKQVRGAAARHRRRWLAPLAVLGASAAVLRARKPRRARPASTDTNSLS